MVAVLLGAFSSSSPKGKASAEAQVPAMGALATVKPYSLAGIGVLAVSKQEVVLRKRATGLVMADETRLVRVRPLSRGRLTEMKVELGSRVGAGDVIAVYDNIESGDLSGQLAIARAGLAQARAEADTERRAVERARELSEIGGIPKADLERRTADHARAVAALRTQEAEIARIQARLRRAGINGAQGEQSTLVSPIDGVVIKIDAAAGELVDTEREVFLIADLRTVWVQAEVLERDLGLVVPGLAVEVSVGGYSDRPFAGQVAYVGQILDPKTNTVRVRCVVANESGALRLNMFARVEFIAPTGREAVMVPAGAIQLLDGKAVVFVRRDAESFELRTVERGIEERGWVEIAGGLNPGDAVVTTGSFELGVLWQREAISGR